VQTTPLGLSESEETSKETSGWRKPSLLQMKMNF